MDWFEGTSTRNQGKSTRNHGFDHKISGFPVKIFPSANSLGYPVIHLCPSALDDIHYGMMRKLGYDRKHRWNVGNL